MKFIVSLLLTALLSFVAGLYINWWGIAIAAFIVALCIRQKPDPAFVSGFLALFLLWGVLSFWISSSNEHVLAHKISLVFLKIGSPYLLMLATAFIGGIVAGFAAMTGSFLRRGKKVTEPSY